MFVRSTPRPIFRYALVAILLVLIGIGTIAKPVIAQESASYRNEDSVLIAQGADGVEGSDDDNTFTAEDGDVGFGRCQVSTNGSAAQFLGFIICPVVELIMDSIDWAEKHIVIPYLSINPMAAEDGEPLFELWKIVRNIANIGLVIGFLYLVFTQTTSFNTDAYAIKRMAPRLILATIGIQLSFYIAAIAVDLFNVLGAGVAQITTGVIQEYGAGTTVNIGLNGTSGAALTGLLGFGTFSLLRGALQGSAGLISPIMGFLVAALITVIAVVITLVLRQIVIAGLVVIAPIAFAAALLPNTEKLFDTWRSILVKALMMYPLIIGLFAMGKLFGLLTLGFAGNGPGAEGIAGIIAFMANIVPLVIIPFTFKLAGGVIGGVMNFANTRAKNAQHATTNRQNAFMRKYNEMDDERYQAYDRRRAHEGDQWQPKYGWSNRLLARAGRAGKLYAIHRTHKSMPMYGLTRASRRSALSRYVRAMKQEQETFSGSYTTPASYEASGEFIRLWGQGRGELKKRAKELMSMDDPYMQQTGRNLASMADATNEQFYSMFAAAHATQGAKMGTHADIEDRLNDLAKGYMIKTDGGYRFKNDGAYREYDRLLQMVSKSGGRSMMSMGKIGAFTGRAWNDVIDLDGGENAFSWGGNTKGLTGEHFTSIQDPILRQDRQTNAGIWDAFGDLERYGMGQVNNNASAQVLRAMSEDWANGKYKSSFFGDDVTSQERANLAAKGWGTTMSQTMSNKTKYKVMDNLNAVVTGQVYEDSAKGIHYYRDLGPAAISFLETPSSTGEGTIAQSLLNQLRNGETRPMTAEEIEFLREQEEADGHH